MIHNCSRFRPVVLLHFLAVICVTIPLVLSVEVEAHSWDTVGKDADALDSLLSKLQMGKLQNILKNIPPAELQKIASRLQRKINAGDTESQKKKSIMEAMKAEGLLDSWKMELDGMIFDDNAIPNESDEKANQFQKSLNCNNKDGGCSSQPASPASQIEEAVHEMLGNTESNGTPSSTREQIERNDLDFLFQEAAEIFETPSENLKPPKLVPPPYKPNQKPSSSYQPSGPERVRGESVKKPSRKNNDQEPLSALVGMAKQFLGQDENDKTLDMVANMASLYLNNMDTSGNNAKKTAPKNSGPDIGAMLQFASLLSANAGGKSGGNGGPDLSSLLQLASLFGGESGGDAANNPVQSLLSLLGNSGVDMNQIIQMGSMLMNKGSASSVSRKSQSTSPMVDLVIRFVANWLEMDPDLLLNYVDGVSQLVEAKSWNEINIILRRSTGTDVETMLDMMANDDIRQQFSDTSTDFVAHWLRTNVNPDSFQSRLLYINALLQQYNYPPIDPQNEVESVSRVVERLSGDFLNMKIDLRPYLRHVEKQLKDVLHIVGPQKLDFRNFSEEELSHAVRYTMKNEVFDPLADLWADFRLASRVPKCARTILCRRNIPGTYKSQAGLKEGITRGARYTYTANPINCYRCIELKFFFPFLF